MTLDDAGRLTGTRELIKCPLPAGTNFREWEWQFDPLKEYNPGFITVSKVVALEVVTSNNDARSACFDSAQHDEQ